MSTTATAPAASLRNDLAAGERHFLARLRMTLRDPFALGLLAFAGIVTVPLWLFAMGIDPLTARQQPWPAGATLGYTGPPPTALQLAVRLPDTAVVLFQILWAALVAGAVGRESTLRRWPATTGRGLPALPVGPRARVVADVLVAISLLLAARALVLSIFGIRLGALLYGHHPWLAVYREVASLRDVANLLLGTAAAIPPALAYTSAFVVNTILGTLFALPLVLAWMTTARLDGRGLVKLVTAALLLFASASVGAMAHLASAVLVALGVSAFLLVRLDDGSRSRPGTATLVPPLRFRASLGPLHQLRRDFWLGPLQIRGLFVALAVAVPLIPTLVYKLMPELFYETTAHGLLRHPPPRLMAMAALAVLLQWLALLALPFFPFGLALIPSTTPASGMFRGTFLRAWGALPVPREAVVRAVYAHGLLAAGLAWLVLGAHARLLGARLGPVLYELPVIFLIAGIALCEAVGDRRRGLLAVGAFAAYQFGVPFTYAAFGRELTLASHGVPLTLAGCVASLVGILPALTHLRRRAAPLTPAAGVAPASG